MREHETKTLSQSNQVLDPFLGQASWARTLLPSTRPLLRKADSCLLKKRSGSGRKAARTPQLAGLCRQLRFLRKVILSSINIVYLICRSSYKRLLPIITAIETSPTSSRMSPSKLVSSGVYEESIEVFRQFDQPLGLRLISVSWDLGFPRMICPLYPAQ